MVKKTKNLAYPILSLSLLTVMAGAAIAPALEVIQEYFVGVNPLYLQMIVSIPAIFIVITNLLFPKLCKLMKSKALVLSGLILYTVGGCIAGVFNNIFLILVARALVGIGVGIIMPLSTGLLAFYFPPKEQDRLMGYSSAMNQMGGVIATLLSGLLAAINWRASFLVYLLGLLSIVLCLFMLPNDKIHSNESSFSLSGFKEYLPFIGCMFLHMVSFFVYPTNFAMVTASEKIIPQHFIAVIMASCDFVAFFGGLAFVHIKKHIGETTKFFAPTSYLIGYLILAFVDGVPGAVIGSLFVGFANGIGIPYIIAVASKKAGKLAATTVMPLLSAALYLAQFVMPFMLSLVTSIAVGASVKLPFYFAIVTSILFILCSLTMHEQKD